MKKPTQGKTASRNAKIVTADALKERFKAQSIPLESDFADLIDMAEAGCKAAGQAGGQNGPGDGLVADETTGILSVFANTESNTITVDPNGISVKTTTLAGQGLYVQDDALAVAVTPGLTVDQNGLALHLNETQGLMVEHDLVRVKTRARNATSFDSEGYLKVLLSSTSGLETTENGLLVAANTASCLKIDGSGVGIDLDALLIKMFARLHGASFIAASDKMFCTFTNKGNSCVAAFYSRMWVPIVNVGSSTDRRPLLNSTNPTRTSAGAFSDASKAMYGAIWPVSARAGWSVTVHGFLPEELRPDSVTMTLQAV